MYEIFISYTNHEPDKALAGKLFDKLNSDYFPVFWDKARLDAGSKWNEQLGDSIKTSNHLLVIWSEAAQKSDWVQREIAEHKAHNKDGLIFFVCLDALPAAYSEYQLIQNYKTDALYPGKMEGVEAERALVIVVNTVLDAVYKKKGSRPIHRVVLTLNKDKLNAAGIRQETKDEIRNNYGDHYSDWKPFGSGKNIKEILDNLLYADINLNAGKKNVFFHWKDLDWMDISSKLWLPSKDANGFIEANRVATKAEIDLLEEGPCVLILDPYSLNDSMIKEMFMRLYQPCVENPQAVIMALNSYPLSPQLNSLRQQLLNDAERFYENYYEPKMTIQNPLADCYANIMDDMEIRRVLRVTLRNLINDAPGGGGGNNPYTRGEYKGI